MSELIQETFLGCSVRSFNFNMGWGNSSSVLSVALVEDDALFQKMGLIQDGLQKHYVDPVGMVGQLARFNYGGWIFDGIVANIYERKSESGNRVWDVNLTDPRELMDGVQLILSGYTGFTYGVPNLYNIFGYLESFGYGFSEINEAGIPWNKVVQATIDLVNQTPIYLAGVPFFIDLSSLPSIPSYFRISGNAISLLGLIQEVCQTANFEFTCILIGNTIKIICIDRNIGYVPGALTRFLQSIDTGFSELESGYEVQYNVTNKFLVGPQVEQVYYQFNNVGPNLIGRNGKKYNPTYDDTISRFWGLDIAGNVVTAQRQPLSMPGNQFNTNESFFVDGTSISYPGMNWYQYPIDIEELRAALISRGTWESFLWMKNWQSTSIHHDKARRLGITSDFKDNLFKNIPVKNMNVADVANFDAATNIAEQHEAYLERVYRFVSNFASNYMGSKFMVKIPFLYSKTDTDSGQITTNLEPTESGYIEESLFNQAVSNGLMPDFTDFVRNEEGKIIAYVRFGPFLFEELDLSNIQENDYYISGQYLFVKCEVDPKIVYLDRATRFSPRVVVTIPGPIYFTNESDVLNLFEQAYIREMLIELFKNNVNSIPPNARNGTEDEQVSEFLSEASQVDRIRHQNKIRKPNEPFQNPTLFQQFSKNVIDGLKVEFAVWKHKVGGEYTFVTVEQISLIPSMAAIPLKNNTTVYGPWYSTGFQGKVEFEQNYDLAPWNFGGFANLNRAGQAIVSSIYTNSMIGESGSITIPGIPALQPASQLIRGGPMVSQIDVSVGEQGVITTYRLGRWNATYGKQISENIENFKKIYSIKRDQARAFRSLFKPKTPPDAKNTRFGTGKRNLPKPRRITSSTSHAMLICSTYEDVNNKKANNIGSVPYYHVPNITAGEWKDIAGCSFDGIFRPFCTSYNPSGVTGMPHFTDPSGYNGNYPTVANLNPFQEGHDIKVAFRGETSSETISNASGISPSGEYRGIALKAPLILAGWGHDLAGSVVPEGGHQASQENYKVGPLDVRWDESRGVWGNGFEIYEGVLTSNITPPSTPGLTTTFTIDTYTNSPAWNKNGSNLVCTNRDPSLEVNLITNNINYAGKIFVIAMRIGKEIRPIWVGCPDLIG